MRIPPWAVVATMIVAAAPPSHVLAQSTAPAPDTIGTPSPSPQNAIEAQQPAAVGEEATKPVTGSARDISAEPATGCTVFLARSARPGPLCGSQREQDSRNEPHSGPERGFLSSLVHDLGDDFRHMPRRNSFYWLGGGAALALAAHSEDNDINAHLVGQNGLWTPGKYIGSTELLLPAAFATYLVGRRIGANRVQHLGMDEMEALLIAEGVAQSVKLAVRRPRPPELDGSQSHTYSFPSGHATLTFAAATVLQQHLGYRAAIPTYLVASYVAMSRLHDNRHYASDVIFGAATGIMIGRSVTWHGRNFYASPMLVPGGGGLMIAAR